MVMHIHLRPFALALSLTLLAAGSGPAGAAQELEQIVSMEPTPAGIAVTVQTGGCTKKADFEVSSCAAGGGEGDGGVAPHQARHLQGQLSRRPQIAIHFGGAEPS